MSEYKCQEPGCHFHIGIGGPTITDLDIELQDYYDQGVEEHYQMHEEQKRETTARMVAALFRSQLQERDKDCRVCGGEFSTARKSMAAPTILHLDPAKDGLEYLARVHRVCEIDLALRAGHPAVKRMLEQNRELAKRSLVEQADHSGGFKAVAEVSRGGFVGVDVVLGSVVKHEVRTGVNPQRVSVSVQPTVGADVHLEATASLDLVEQDLLEGIKRFAVNVKLSRDVSNGMNESPHQFSLSVDAPNGTVVSTPESTERGQTPTSSEAEMPSAVAPAEGGETNDPDQ